MEVVGLVAAIPGLIDIVQKSISVVRAFSDQKSFVKQITGLLDQLELVENILQDVLGRLKSSSIHHSNLSHVTTITQGLKRELSTLNDLFQPLTVNSPSQKAKVRQRARLLKYSLKGLKGEIRKRHEALVDARESLALIITAQNRAIEEENLTISRKSLRLKLKEVLLPCAYSFIPQNLQGTCDWIGAHPSFCKWQTDPANSSPADYRQRIMCIYGPKGCGKSVLAASIVERLKSPGSIAVGFSFWAGSDDQRKLLAFMRTFLWHLIQKIPDEDLTQISALLLENLPLNERTLEDAVLAVLKTIKSPIFCVIDGIDESVDDWTRPNSGGLRLIVELLEKNVNLRILLLGRVASMQSAASLTALKIEITEDLIRPDINHFIVHHLDSSLKIQDAATRQLVQETLQQNSDVMFLWVTLIFGELSRCQLPSEIARTLRQVPMDLDREYHRLLACLQDRLGGSRNKPSVSMKRAKCLLSWIIAAPEPLTYEELRCAFAISQCPNKEYDQHMLSKAGIMDSCGDFIRVSDGRYHITHASIIEFLARPIGLWQLEDEAIDYFCIDVPQSQIQMFLECTTYFERIDLGYPLVDTTAAMSLVSLPIFSCALKFARIYLMSTYESEHRVQVLGYLQDFVRTQQFCSLLECVSFILQDEAAVSSAQRAEIMDFIVWVIIQRTLGEAAFSDLEPGLQEELARRNRVFGQDDDRSRTWKIFVDVLLCPLAAGRITDSGHTFGNSDCAKEEETFAESHIHSPRDILGVEHRQAAEHTAMLKIGDAVAARAHVLQHLAGLGRRLTNLVPRFLATPFLVLLALREPNPAREEELWSIALKRVAGSNNFLEAVCAHCLGSCRLRRGGWDEIVGSLLDKSRQITTNLPSSLHVESLLCATLYFLARHLLCDQVPSSQVHEIVSELQQRLSNGPKKGYISTRMERTIYSTLFWDDWKAELLAKIAHFYAYYPTGAFSENALKMINLNRRLYENPGPRRLSASIEAHCAVTGALYSKWCRNGCKIYGEAQKLEISCQATLNLVQFPNSTKYISIQWHVLRILCYMYNREDRHIEARELVSRIPLNIFVDACRSVIVIAATAVRLGDLKTGELILARASSQIQNQPASSLLSESKNINNLITALFRVRPIIRLWLPLSLCYQDWQSKEISTALNERDFWYGQSDCTYIDDISCSTDFWDVLYIRYLILTGHDEWRKYSEIFRFREFEFELSFKSNLYACHCHSQFVFGCEKLAFEYAQKQNYEAAAVVSRYLISYSLQRHEAALFRWALYYRALYLHFVFREEEALATCRSMLWWTKTHMPSKYMVWHYVNIGIACFKIGDDIGTKNTPQAVEFFALAELSFAKAGGACGIGSSSIAKIDEWHSQSQSALRRLGVLLMSREPIPSSYCVVRILTHPAAKVKKHQSCPDLRATYIKAGQSHRATYNRWRKQSVGIGRNGTKGTVLEVHCVDQVI
ncbi:hypothetical protein F5Y03DRAFT_92059 [Xylaria venustula]|nr:hypothetical protein F5Y03DRAFT_92059 [Xylaria venustula]